MSGMRTLITAFLIGIVVAACSSASTRSESTSSSVIVTSSSSTISSVIDSTQAPTTTTRDAATTSTSTTLGVPVAFLADPLPTGAALIASEHGIVITTQDGTTVMNITPVDVVAGDGDGGLLFQQRGSIWWLEVGASAPRFVVTDATAPTEAPFGATVGLKSGALINGEPHALYVMTQRFDPEIGVVPVVVVHDLKRGTEEVFFTDQAGEGGAGDAWYGGGVLSAWYGFEGFSYFLFEDLEAGRTVPNPRPHESNPKFPRRQVGPSVISADGSLFLYLESPDFLNGTAEDEIDLIVFDMTSGREERRLSLLTGDFYYGRIDFDGRSVLLSRFVLLREGGLDWLPVLKIGDLDQDGGIIPELAWTGPATFTR